MSAYVLDKADIDRMVSAALHAYRGDGPNTAGRLSWWRTDDDGSFAGWRELNVHAETMADDDYKGYMTPSMLGQMLVNENVTSVLYRYSESGRTYYYGAEHAAEMDDDTIETLPGPCDRYYMGPYVFEDPREEITPGAVFALLDCYDYQSCEHPEWRASEAYAFCRSLREAWCRRVSDAEQDARVEA